VFISCIGNLWSEFSEKHIGLPGKLYVHLHQNKQTNNNKKKEKKKKKNGGKKMAEKLKDLNVLMKNTKYYSCY